MKPENALPAYLYCKLLSTFQPHREKYREDGTSRKNRRERERESGKTCSGQSSTQAVQKKNSKLQVKQTKTDPEIAKV